MTAHTFTRKREVKVRKILTLRPLLALVRPFLPTKLVRTPLLVTWARRIARHVNTVGGLVRGHFHRAGVNSGAPTGIRGASRGTKEAHPAAVRVAMRKLCCQTSNNTKGVGGKIHGKWLKTRQSHLRFKRSSGSTLQNRLMSALTDFGLNEVVHFGKRRFV